MSTQNSSPEATDSFELPDVLDETPDCMDFAAAFHKYRDVMDYNSRLILVLVRTERLSKETLDKLSPITQVFEYTLVCVLLTTKNGGDIIHLDKKVWDNPHCNTIRAEAVNVYDALMKDNIIPNISRNFRIMHICIGYALFDIDTMAKENDLHFYLEGGTFVKECVPNFIRDQDVPDMPTYLRTAHAYYTTTFRVLMRFIVTHLEMIVEDVGIPELLPLVKEDEEENDKYKFITLKEQSRRMLTRRKEALEAELQKINAALSSQATNAAEDGTH